MTNMGFMLILLSVPWTLHMAQAKCCTSLYCAVDCSDIQNLGFTTSGVYHIYPVGTLEGFDVYCDMETTEGGWTVFQRRQDGHVDFNMTWKTYIHGFGDLNGEHWLGNQKLHILTSQAYYQLRIDLTETGGSEYFVGYLVFKVGDLLENYALAMEDYIGNSNFTFGTSNRLQFSTHNRDNDMLTNEHCAQQQGGGWWYLTSYINCYKMNPNGLFNTDSSVRSIGIHWQRWADDIHYLQKVEMKIKRL